MRSELMNLFSSTVMLIGSASGGITCVGKGWLEKALIGFRNLCLVVIGRYELMALSLLMYKDLVVALKMVFHLDRRCCDVGSQCPNGIAICRSVVFSPTCLISVFMNIVASSFLQM